MIGSSYSFCDPLKRSKLVKELLIDANKRIFAIFVGLRFALFAALWKGKDKTKHPSPPAFAKTTSNFKRILGNRGGGIVVELVIRWPHLKRTLRYYQSILSMHLCNSITSEIGDCPVYLANRYGSAQAEVMSNRKQCAIVHVRHSLS